MKRAIKYLIRIVLFIVIIYSVMIILGEPTDDVTLWEVVWLKLSSAGMVWLCSRVWLLTMSKQERKRLFK